MANYNTPSDAEMSSDLDMVVEHDHQDHALDAFIRESESPPFRYAYACGFADLVKSRTRSVVSSLAIHLISNST